MDVSIDAYNFFRAPLN